MDKNKYQNKYRIPSARLQSWNYASVARYFITICTKNMEHSFGEINNDEMILSSLGEVVAKEWLKTIEIRPDMNLQFGEWQFMPNHFHAIIMIGANIYNSGSYMHLRNSNSKIPQNKFGPQSKNLAAILKGFKSSVTSYAKNNKIDFCWQSRFHDHIIRNNDEYHRISHYILNNVRNGAYDKFYPSNIKAK